MDDTLHDAAPTEERLIINHELSIPTSELRYRFSRSSGPGGQHANRSETRVELFYDVQGSPSLTEEQRARLLRRLSGYIDGDGTLHLFSSVTRSQLANRADVTARFQSLVRTALAHAKPRLSTRPTRASRERRLTEKRQRSETKQGRRGDFD